MTTAVVPATAASAIPVVVTGSLAQPSAMMIEAFGYSLNLMSVMIVVLLLGLLFLFYRIQKTQKLDFADMITKDGRAVSLTKVLQLVGGITATWVVIKLTVGGTLTEAILGIYLTYVGAVEGYSKYVAAKYGYNEKSVKDAAADRMVEDGAGVKPKE